MIMAILMMLLAIKREARTALGSSRRVTILFQELSCLVFRILISLKVREKKATSDPASTKEMISKKRMMIARIVVACGLMTRNTGENLSKMNSFVKG
jgi:hypothetical protein